AFLVAAPAYAKSGPNPFGITIVRFSSGTTPAQMQAAVVSAGGSVVTDLSPVGALAVAPVARDFRGRIAANARVIDAFREPLCDALRRQYGENLLKQVGLTDCGTDDREGHGTWVASRIAGNLNGFASNCVAPRIQVSSYKVLAAGFGALPDWLLAGLVAACSDGVDLVNMSITGYLDPSDPADAQTYVLFDDAVQYCRARGVTIFAAA